jgi:hypothetical protein
VLVPYFGAFPTFESDKLNTPPRIYFDFKALPRNPRLVTQLVSQNPELVRWTIAPRPGGLTRLVLQFASGADVLVLNDASRRQIVLMIQDGPALTMPPAAQALVPPPPKKPISRVPEATRSFFQTFGHTDFKYSVGPRPKHAKHDQVTVDVAAQGVSEFNVTADPANDFINFSISIAGKGRATPRPIWTPPPPLPTTRPTPSPLPSSDLIFEPRPLATPTPEPEPTPVPTPEPSPSATPAEKSAAPSTSLSFFGGSPVSVSEGSAESDSNRGHEFSASGASIQGVAFDTRFGEWVYHLNVDHHRIEVIDEQTSQLTGNERDTYMINTGIGYSLAPWQGADFIVGAGYHFRYLNTVTMGFLRDNSGVETDRTPIAPPQDATILNAPAQLFHGPVFHSRLIAPLYDPLGFDFRLAGGPLFGALDVPEYVGALFGVWGTPALYYDFGSFRTSLGVDFSLAYGGAGYNFSRFGPLARMEMRF